MFTEMTASLVCFGSTHLLQDKVFNLMLATFLIDVALIKKLMD